MRAALRGLGTALGNPDVRATYIKFTLALLAVTVVLGGGMTLGVWHLTAASAEASTWATAGLWALRLMGTLIALLAAPVLALFAIDLLFPLLSERVFFAGLRRLDPGRAEALAARPGLSLSASTWSAVALFCQFVALTLAALLVGLIPVVGPVLGPAMQVWVTARTLGWELLEPYFDKQRMAFSAQRAYVGERGAAIVGFGLPCSLLLAVPLVGALFFGLVQAAAPALLVDVLEPE